MQSLLTPEQLLVGFGVLIVVAFLIGLILGKASDKGKAL